MKSISLLILLLITSIIESKAAELDSKALAVTIYHNGALVERHVQAELLAGTHELTIPGISSKAVMKSLSLSDKNITVLQSEIVRKSTDEQMQQLFDTKESLQAQLRLLESKYTETGFIKEVSHLEKMMQYYGHKILEIKRSIRANEQKIEDAKSLEAIAMSNKDAAVLKLTISTPAAIAGSLVLKYVVGGIGWSPAYEIDVDNSAQRSISMKFLCKVMNQTGEDWANVSMQLSSASPVGDPVVLPMTNNPWVLRDQDNKFNRYNEAMVIQGNDGRFKNAGSQGVYNMQWGTDADIEKLSGVEYQDLSVPSFLKPRVLDGKYSIPSNGTIFTFPISTNEIPAEFYYYGYPSLDQEVYLVAELVDWDSYGFIDGMANISYGGNEVGRSMILWSEVTDTLMLPIGRDNSVFMSRNEIADKKYFKETRIGKKRKSTLAFDFNLKNNNPFPVKFRLLDQIPISQTRAADVEIETLSKGVLDKENGEVVWELELAQGESQNRQLIYTIDLASGYVYKKKSQQRLRTIKSPMYF